MLDHESELLFANTISSDQLSSLVNLVMLKSIGLWRNPDSRKELHQLAYLVDTLTAMCKHKDILERYMSGFLRIKKILIAIDCLTNLFLQRTRPRESTLFSWVSKKETREAYDLRFLSAKLCLIIANSLLVNRSVFRHYNLLDLRGYEPIGDAETQAIFKEFDGVFDAQKMMLNMLLLVQEFSISNSSGPDEPPELIVKPSSWVEKNIMVNKAYNPVINLDYKFANTPPPSRPQRHLLESQSMNLKYLIAPVRLFFLILYSPHPEYVDRIPKFSAAIFCLTNLVSASIKNVIWCYFKSDAQFVHNGKTVDNHVPEDLLVELLKCLHVIFHNYGNIISFEQISPIVPEPKLNAKQESKHIEKVLSLDSIHEINLNDIHILLVFLAKLLSLDKKFTFNRVISTVNQQIPPPYSKKDLWINNVDLSVTLYKNFANVLLTLPFKFYDNFFFVSDSNKQKFSNDSSAIMRTLFLYYSTKPVKILEIILVGIFGIINYELSKSNINVQSSPKVQKSPTTKPKKKKRSSRKNSAKSPEIVETPSSNGSEITETVKSSIIESITNIDHEDFVTFLSVINYFLKFKNHLKNEINKLKKQIHNNRFKYNKIMKKETNNESSDARKMDGLQFDQTLEIFQKLTFVGDLTDFFERFLSPLRVTSPISNSRKNSVSSVGTVGNNSTNADLFLFRNLQSLKLIKENDVKSFQAEEVLVGARKRKVNAKDVSRSSRITEASDETSSRSLKTHSKYKEDSTADDEDFNSYLVKNSNITAGSSSKASSNEAAKDTAETSVTSSKKTLGSLTDARPKKAFSASGQKNSHLRKSKSTGILRSIQFKIRPTDDFFRNEPLKRDSYKEIKSEFQGPRALAGGIQTPPRKGDIGLGNSYTPISMQGSSTPTIFDPQRPDDSHSHQERSPSVTSDQSNSSGRKNSFSALFQSNSHNGNSPFKKLGGISPKRPVATKPRHSTSTNEVLKRDTIEARFPSKASPLFPEVVPVPRAKAIAGVAVPPKFSAEHYAVSKHKKELRELLLILACEKDYQDSRLVSKTDAHLHKGFGNESDDQKNLAYFNQVLADQSNCYKPLMKCCKNPFVNTTIKLLIVEIYFNLVTEHTNSMNEQVSSPKQSKPRMKRIGSSEKNQKLDFGVFNKFNSISEDSTDADENEDHFKFHNPDLSSTISLSSSKRMSMISSISGIDEMTKKATTINDFFLKFQNLKNLQIFLLVFLGNDLFYLIFLFFQDNKIIEVNEEELRIITEYLRSSTKQSSNGDGKVTMSNIMGTNQVRSGPSVNSKDDPDKFASSPEGHLEEAFDYDLYLVSDDENEFVDKTLDREKLRRNMRPSASGIKEYPRTTIDLDLDSSVDAHHKTTAGSLGSRSMFLMSRTKTFLAMRASSVVSSNYKSVKKGETSQTIEEVKLPNESPSSHTEPQTRARIPDPSVVSKFDNFSFQNNLKPISTAAKGSTLNNGPDIISPTSKSAGYQNMGPLDTVDEANDPFKKTDSPFKRVDYIGEPIVVEGGDVEDEDEDASKFILRKPSEEKNEIDPLAKPDQSSFEGHKSKPPLSRSIAEELGDKGLKISFGDYDIGSRMSRSSLTSVEKLEEAEKFFGMMEKLSKT